MVACMENHDWDIQGRVKMTSPPAAVLAMRLGKDRARGAGLHRDPVVDHHVLPLPRLPVVELPRAAAAR